MRVGRGEGNTRALHGRVVGRRSFAQLDLQTDPCQEV